MKLVSDIFTIAEKELKLQLRFKFPFFTSSFITPLIRITPFFMVYAGFFYFGAEALGEVTRTNFVVFLTLGMLADVIFNIGYEAFHTKFMQEKYWGTIESIFLAPVHRVSLILGVGLAEVVRGLPSTAIFLIICYLIIPVNIANFGVILLTFLMAYVFILSVGIIYGSAALFNESFLPIFEYLRVAWVFFSCFYFPIEVIPEILKPWALINPIYQANVVIRGLWISGVMHWQPFIYLLLLAILAPLLAILIFNKLWKELTIQGY